MAAETQQELAAKAQDPGESYDLEDDEPTAVQGNLPPVTGEPSGEEGDGATADPEVTDDGDTGDAPPKGDEPDAVVDANADLIAQAQELGYSEPVAKALADAGQLDPFLADIESSALATGRAAIAAQDAEATPAPAPDPETPAPAPTPEPVTPDAPAVTPFELTFPEDSLLDEGVREQLQGMTKHYADQIATLTAQVQEVSGLKTQFDEMQAEATKRQAAVYVQEWDEFFAGLPAQYHTAFGTQACDDLAPDSPEAKQRVKYADTRRAVALGLESLGRPVSQKLVDAIALRDMFPTVAQATDSEDVDTRVRDRDGRYAARPTRRRARQETGDAAAVANIQAKKEQFGGDVDADDDAELLD